jgi:hypothetical protein
MPDTPPRSTEPPVTLALNRRQAARALGMSLASFQRHVQPHVPTVYVGQMRLYPVKELERWLAQETCQGGRRAAIRGDAP